MVWTCAKEGEWIYLIKHARYGAAKQEEKKKTIEKVLGVVKEDMQRISWKEEDAGDSGDGGK